MRITHPEQLLAGFTLALPNLLRAEACRANQAPRQEQSEHHWTPRADIRETSAAYEIDVDLPGVDPQAVSIEVEKGLLKLQGNRGVFEQEEGVTLHRQERRSGSFIRHFQLPENVEVSGIQARGNQGVLSLVLPKREPIQPQKIEVQVS